MSRSSPAARWPRRGRRGGGTLTIDGDLTLQGGSLLSYALGQAGVAGGALNDLTNVGGNLALGGTLNVSTSTGGTFGPGVYRLFNYGGTHSGSLTLGTMSVSGNYFIQTSVDKQVNLVNADGLTLNYWDGDAGPKNNGLIDGGSGTWRAGGAGTSDNWANTTGMVNAAWSQDAFAVFTGQGGSVRADSSTALQVQGMQFAVDGYALVNNDATDALTLTGAAVSGGGPNEAEVRVGDGSAGGAGFTANVAATLVGAARLVKTDLGTLTLSGVNTTPAAPPSRAARCRYRRTSILARRRARCHWTAARWPRPRASARRAPSRWAWVAASTWWAAPPILA